MKSLICNLKSNLTFEEILNYKKNLENLEVPNLIVCPPFCYLPIMHSKKFLIGAQDVSEFGNGPYTGKVSARMLKSFDTFCVLLNHIELKNKRNKVLAKLKKCLKAKLNVYLFLSETKDEHNYQYTNKVLQEQIHYYLKDLKKEDYKLISFIYEPSWLIGLESLESNEINTIITNLKEELENTYQHSFNVLYGGGVDENLIQKLKNSNVDGFAIGNNCLDINKVIKIINILKN